MDDGNVVIECQDCEFRESFANLGRARVALDDHESETSHSVNWRIDRVAAGVCGVAGCENPDSALLDWQQFDDES